MGGISLADAIEAVEAVADEIAEEDMMGASREQVAEGTAVRIKRRLREIDAETERRADE